MFYADCRQCDARAVSRSPEFFEARTTGKQTREYRALLTRLSVTHEEVLQAFEADATRSAN
jgi:hypothetical protein